MYGGLPKSTEAQVSGKQVLRSGTSVGAHLTEANRARSSDDFVNKINGALQELDETSYWFRLLARAEIVDGQRLGPLTQEADELTAILVTIAAKTRKSQHRSA